MPKFKGCEDSKCRDCGCSTRKVAQQKSASPNEGDLIVSWCHVCNTYQEEKE